MAAGLSRERLLYVCSVMPKAVMRIHGLANRRTCSFLRVAYKVTPESLACWASAAICDPQPQTWRSFWLSALAWAPKAVVASRQPATIARNTRMLLS
ncbi:hypothetical protein D3C73_1399130 [compost metagenome]